MKYWINLSYDGTNYKGYGTQPHKNTIQDHLEDVLSKLFNEKIKTTAASRTDSGVHALMQMVTFFHEKKFEEENLLLTLNKMLNKDIVANSVQSNFEDIHVRHDVKWKEYEYHITHEYNLFKRNHEYYIRDVLDIELMKEASSYLIGKHDFESFCNKNTNTNNFVRTIFKIDFQKNQKRLIIRFRGDGFLYNMIRIIVGTLVEIGKKRIEPEKMKEILDSKSRIYSSRTIEAKGLYLKKISYEEG